MTMKSGVTDFTCGIMSALRKFQILEHSRLEGFRLVLSSLDLFLGC